MKIDWDDPDARYFQHGIDRGVLYPRGKKAVPWNGITGFDEAGNGESSIHYIDGKIFLADVEPSDFSGQLTAFMYPDEFSECIGVPEAADGFYVDNQRGKQFDFCYRSLIGSGVTGDMFGYQLHLVYNAMATIGARQRKTLTNTPAPMDFTFDIVATPVALPGYRPSAHYIIDTRHLDKSTIATLEGIIYGTPTEDARMPTPLELFDTLNFGSAITFTTWNHPTLGLCWTARGSYVNVHMTSDTTWEILNVNGVDHGDGTYTLSDTP